MNSSYCKGEANMAFRANIPMVVCCVEEGYEADYWLAVITAAAPGIDCSTDEKLASSLDRLEKELKAARRLLKPKYYSILQNMHKLQKNFKYTVRIFHRGV